MTPGRSSHLAFLDTGSGPAACVMALHGRGVTGEDLAPMAQELGLPGVRWIFPHGPVPFDPIPGGREWFSLEGASLSNWKTPVDHPKLSGLFSGLQSAQTLVAGLLDQLYSQGVDPKKTALLGFSQGAALALDVALFSGRPLAACAALSGVLPRVPKTGLPASAPEFFLAHGTHDDILPPALGRAASASLKARGARVAFKEYPMGHGMCAEELADLRAFLRSTLFL